jgi:hypothetical protein
VVAELFGRWVFLPPGLSSLVGWGYPAILRLSHSSADLRRVSGTYELVGLVESVHGHCDVYSFASSVPLTGHVSNDGHLTLSGATATLDGSERWAVAGWDTHLTAPGEMRGRWAQDFAVASGKSYWEVDVELKATERDSCGHTYGDRR